MNCKYFILDIATGNFDGFYRDLDVAQSMLKSMKEDFSHVPWILCEVIVGPDDKDKFFAWSDKSFWGAVGLKSEVGELK